MRGSESDLMMPVNVQDEVSVSSQQDEGQLLEGSRNCRLTRRLQRRSAWMQQDEI
jgi:hypothetical protein